MVFGKNNGEDKKKRPQSKLGCCFLFFLNGKCPPERTEEETINQQEFVGDLNKNEFPA